jgi:hypothetical protein
VRVDAQDLVWLLSGVADDRLSFDLARSISSGGVVFTTAYDIQEGDATVYGKTVGGTVTLGTWVSRDQLAGSFAHERVHVLQFDFLKTVIGYPLEGWLLGHVPFLERVPLARSVLPGVAYVIGWYPLSGMWDRPADLLEVEAEFLERR